MNEETAKRIERKIDYLAGFIASVCGAGIGWAIIANNTWGSWSEWIAVLVFLLFPAFFWSSYRNIGKSL